jgi:hypothetical protein
VHALVGIGQHDTLCNDEETRQQETISNILKFYPLTGELQYLASASGSSGHGSVY